MRFYVLSVFLFLACGTEPPAATETPQQNTTESSKEKKKFSEEKKDKSSKEESHEDSKSSLPQESDEGTASPVTLSVPSAPETQTSSSTTTSGNGSASTPVVLPTCPENLVIVGRNITSPAMTWIYKCNSNTWNLLGTFNNQVNSILQYGLDIYAGGTFTTVNGTSVSRIAKYSSGNWSQLGGGLDNSVKAMSAYGSNIYIGGNFTGYLSKWNGTSFTSIGTSLSGGVTALAHDSTGALYIGGSFTGVTSKIAKLTGTTWNYLGNSLTSSVNALLTDSSNNLFIGGNFSTVNSLTTSGIAKYNGSWTAYANALTPWPTTLALDAAGSLYTGGPFSNSVPTLGKYASNSWSNYGFNATSGIPNVSGYTNKIIINGSEIYVGGNFNTVNNETANGLAVYKNTSWAPCPVPSDIVEIVTMLQM